ncbi:MAG: beta-methylgalactoside transporter, partial [Treponema sp.]|nr:beta-methylgalactoside transporter [Treponema sp.]
MNNASEKNGRAVSLKKAESFGIQYAIYFVFIALILVIAIREPSFLSLNNFRNILSMSATRVIFAMGMGAILITGGVDLSAGRMVGLAAVLSASLLQAADYSRRMYPGMPVLPLILPILAAMIACGVFGFFNGLFISRLKVPAFIATLGSMVAVYGATSLYFDRPPYGAQPIGGLDRRFAVLGTGYIGFDGVYSIPYIVIIAALVTVITYILFNKTTYGKNLYAIGGNAEAARVSGVNVGRTLIVVYTVAGLLYGLGGALEA